MKKRTLRLSTSSAWLALAAALPAPARADAEAAEEQQDDPVVIVVTGRGLPDTPATPAYSTREIPRDELIAAPSGRIEDASRMVGMEDVGTNADV